jgi:hypothetical protein
VALAPHPSPLPRERGPVTYIGRECGVATSRLAGNRPCFRPVPRIGHECGVASSRLAGNRPYFPPVTCIGREFAVAGPMASVADVRKTPPSMPRRGGPLPRAMSPVRRDVDRVHTNHISLMERVPEGG